METFSLESNRRLMRLSYHNIYVFVCLGSKSFGAKRGPASKERNQKMVKYLFVLAHCESKSCCTSLNIAAVHACLAAGHEVKVTDLYAMKFDAATSRANYTTVKNPDYLKPQLEELNATENNGFSPLIEAEIQKLEWCDILVFQFPLHWFHLPAIMKGWCDRVLAMGRIYGGKFGYYTNTPASIGKKKAILSFTTGGPADSYQPGAFNGDIMGILRPIHRGIFEFCGFKVLRPNIVYAAAHYTDVERQKLIEQWADRAAKLSEEEPIEVGVYA